MTEKTPFGEGAYINRPHFVLWTNYQFWKLRMIFFNQLIEESGMLSQMSLLYLSFKKMMSFY